eukprot:TRINITY_DN19178_c0_g1_i1.p1 TRINITY_DN19178_c0_g1~~TRINITY_DN19178_c0_g1_i1.p1  ORF type:complete len:319 (-),score=63.93 TRINITY_DN19178_c0_g1_i1:230-1186(-)
MAVPARVLLGALLVAGARAEDDHCSATEIESALLMRDYKARQECPSWCAKKAPLGHWNFTGGWRCVQAHPSRMEVFCCCSCQSDHDFSGKVFADMHDGDKKGISLHLGQMTIKPSGNNQTWVIKSVFDYETDSAPIDFNVPGKPSPPPVNLTAMYWEFQTSKFKKTVFEFTDPSRTLSKEADYPLNHWVELGQTDHPSPVSCPDLDRVVFADMHDGDKKEISIKGSEMTIKPSGNNQTWTITAVVDKASCEAIVDFSVPGKPAPPPVPLTAIWGKVTADGVAKAKSILEFTDPSGTLAAPGYPLNHWVSIESAVEVMV